MNTEKMQWKYVTPGIPDEEFERLDNIPMTKEEIRAITISKARIKSGSTAMDIGSGSGSITVELSLMCNREGIVFAIDKNPEACSLTMRNVQRLSPYNNVRVRNEDAVSALKVIERLDTIVVGGASDQIEEIVPMCRKALVRGGRIVVNAIMVETVSKSITALNNSGFQNIEAVQISVSRGMQTRNGTAMIAKNPVFVISAEAA